MHRNGRTRPGKMFDINRVERKRNEVHAVNSKVVGGAREGDVSQG